MTVTTAFLWVGAIAALVVIARRLGFRSRRAAYPFGIAVAALIFLLGALTDVSAEVAPLVIVPAGALGLWLAARAGATKW
ncbi:MAG TPA: hypothetical protein VJ747_16470 [Stellaceae bacterium]|nr:hypothetical protein [Stellaceae bacterium]